MGFGGLALGKYHSARGNDRDRCRREHERRRNRRQLAKKLRRYDRLCRRLPPRNRSKNAQSKPEGVGQALFQAAGKNALELRRTQRAVCTRRRKASLFLSARSKSGDQEPA